MSETAEARVVDAQERVFPATASLIARRGIRGATLRDVAADARMPLSTLFQLYGRKEDLLLAGFRHGVSNDAVAFRALRKAAVDLEADSATCGQLLWLLCEPMTDRDRERLQLLTELLLQAPTNPHLQLLAQDWLVNRRDTVRALLAVSGVGTAGADTLLLIHLAETLVAPACVGSLEWRQVARQGFVEAGAQLGAWPASDDPAAFARLAERFHSNPDPELPAGPAHSPSRLQIIAAAAAIIGDTGIAAVTNRAVAERAGCSLAATTYHFQTISDLILAAVMHIYARSRSTPKSGRLVISPDGASCWITGRKMPSVSERVGTTAFIDIALAASRGQIPEALGLAIRRQRGTITHARLEALGHPTDRGHTASAANWFTGVYLVSAALPEAEKLFDFEAQAALVGARIFGFR